MRHVALVLAAGACALTFSLAACATEAPVEKGLRDAVALSYKSEPLSYADRSEHRVGRLIYRGGIEIGSPDPRFGGWSGLVVSHDGKRMLSQSDAAHWLRADLVYDANGDLAGIEDAQLADMRDMDGNTMDKADGDAEGLAALGDAGPDGPVVVSFEGKDRVWHYDLSGSLDVKPEAVTMPDAIGALQTNEGLEGLTVPRPGALLAVAESKQMGPDMPAWLVPYPAPTAQTDYGALSVVPHPPYQISDAAMAPSGKHLFLLERHYFGLLGGIVIAVREIDAADIKAGAQLDGKEIAQFSMHENMDNMEGLALRRGADGKTLLYMISDDNYHHALQHTLLMMFELAPDAQ